MVKRSTKGKFPGWDYVGSLWIKQYNLLGVSNDGVEKFIAGKVLPPGLVVDRYWLNVHIIQDTLLEAVSPINGCYYNIRGAMVEIPPTQVKDETGDVLANVMVGRYMSPYPSEQFEPDDTNEADVGIPGEVTGAASGYMGRRTFFTRRKYLGLPDAAVFTDADKILYTDQFSTRGKVKSVAPMEQGRFLAFAANLDEPAVNTDQGVALWGEADDLGDLQDLILDAFPPFQTAAEAGEDIGRLSTGLNQWLVSGLGSTGPDVARECFFRTHLTLACRMFVRLGSTKYVSTN